MFKLSEAAEYLITSKATSAFKAFIAQITRIITFTQERANRLTRFMIIVKAYKSGALVSDIANKYGCSQWTVLRYARLAGLPNRPREAYTDRKDAVLAELQRGDKLKDIAKRHSCSEAYVSGVAKKAGLNRYKRK